MENQVAVIQDQDQDQASQEQDPEPYFVVSAPTVSGVKDKLYFHVFLMLVSLVLTPFFGFPVVVVILMVPYVIANIKQYRQAKRLDTKGVFTGVTITRCYTYYEAVPDFYRDTPSMTNETVYILEYDLPEGIRIKHSVTKKDYESVKTGDRINIRYMPDCLWLQRVI